MPIKKPPIKTSSQKMPTKKCSNCKKKLNPAQRIACTCRCGKLVCFQCCESHVCPVARDLAPKLPEALVPTTLVDKL